ncbi:MAG: ester cyclase [Dermatophilaceae bacterium]
MQVSQTQSSDVEQVIELWNNGDFDKVGTLMADDQVWVHPSFSLTGSEAVLNRVRADLAGFPDRRINPTKWVEEGDTVVVEYEFTGTNTGPYSIPDGGELAPTGQRMTLRGVDIFEVRDGKTAAHRTYYDRLPTMIQAGLVGPVPQP